MGGMPVMQNSSTDGDPAADGEGLARRLFAGLRDLDEAGAAVIVCPLTGDRWDSARRYAIG